jgi:hypothetical protein
MLLSPDHWHRPWFGDLTSEKNLKLEDARQEFMEFLALEPSVRAHRQALLWSDFGITNTGAGDLMLDQVHNALAG